MPQNQDQDASDGSDDGHSYSRNERQNQDAEARQSLQEVLSAGEYDLPQDVFEAVGEVLGT
jgi:hypothetical protein